GLILYEMLTGKLPFTGNSPMAIALARLHQPLPDLASEPAIPEPLAALLGRCLAREVSVRFQSAVELAEAITSAAVTLGADLSGADGGTLGMPTSSLSSERSSGPLRQRTTSASTSTPTPTTSATPTPGSGRALAVLPFRYRGPAADSYVAETLSD